VSRSTAVRAAVLATVLVAAVVVQLVVGLPSQAEVRTALDGLGPFEVPVFVAVYVAVCLLPAGPTALLTIAGGAVLGFGVGLVAVLVAADLGAVAAFALSRVLGRGVVADSERAWVRRLDARVRDHGFATVLVARLVPLVPFSTANYAFGLTSVRPAHYVAATVVGIVPGTAVYVAVGAFGSEPGSLPFLLAIGGLVLLSLVGLAHRRRGGQRGGPAPEPPSPGAAPPGNG